MPWRRYGCEATGSPRVPTSVLKKRASSLGSNGHGSPAAPCPYVEGKLATEEHTRSKNGSPHAAMAYRRKQGMQRSATFVEDHRHPSPGDSASPATASPRATRFADDSRRPDRTLAAQTLLASAARGDVPALAERFPAAPMPSPGGRQVSPRGREVSPRGRQPSPRGRQVSPLAGRPGDPTFTSSPRASPRAGRSNDPFAQVCSSPDPHCIF
jgi:hypothetical protein